MARIKQLPPPTTKEDILAILGDSTDKEYPIYRNDTPPDAGLTLCTGMSTHQTADHHLREGGRGGRRKMKGRGERGKREGRKSERERGGRQMEEREEHY